MRLKLPPYFALISVCSAALFLSACDNSLPVFEQSKQEEWKDITDTELPKIVNMMSTLNQSQPVAPVELKRSVDDDGNTIIQSIQLNDTNSQCPQRIHQEVDSDTIERNDQYLVGDYCDYYIYPKRGQTISVDVEPHNVRASLRVPIAHDFDNGGYLVEEADTHVIRINDISSRYQNHPVRYNMTISIN